MFNKDSSVTARILDICQELKALSSVLESLNFNFSISLAALASRREYLNLEKWLRDHLQLHGEPFFRASLTFLNDLVAPRSDAPPVPLSIEATRMFLRVLHDANSSFPAHAQDMKRLVQVLQSEDPESTPPFAPDLEQAALAHYEQLYKGEITMPHLIELLTRLKSGTPREQDMFKCMIQYLFDEYKYFSRYPERQLLQTAVLFGALIQNGVVMSMALGIALRYILEALRQPPSILLFKFGVHALVQFQSRLGEWPQYCSLLLQIDHLHTAIPDVMQLVKAMPVQGIAEPQAEEFEPSVFGALSLGGLLHGIEGETFAPPNEAVQDKILFIINNLSFDNMEAKVKDVLDLLQTTHARWFSHYIVVKRASIEPNFHAMYNAFIDSLKMPFVDSIVLHETLSEISDLLNSEKTVNSSQERSLLKNLGTWLGSITLAKNKPIKHQNLAFKDLLLQG